MINWGFLTRHWQIQFFLVNRPKLKGSLVRGLLCSIQAAWGPILKWKHGFFPWQGETESHGGHQTSIAIQQQEPRAHSLQRPANGPLDGIFRPTIAWSQPSETLFRQASQAAGEREINSSSKHKHTTVVSSQPFKK